MNNHVTSYCLMCSDGRDYSKLLCEACQRCNWGDLNKVKELVEQHKISPNGEHVHSVCSISSDKN